MKLISKIKNALSALLREERGDVDYIAVVVIVVLVIIMAIIFRPELKQLLEALLGVLNG